MTVETEVKEVVSEVKAEVATAVKTLASEWDGVAAEVAKVEAEVKPAVERLLQELTAEEKLGIRDIELAYLKAQMEINRLSTTTQTAQTNFKNTVDILIKKYAIDPAEWVFDNIELVFKKKSAVTGPPPAQG